MDKIEAAILNVPSLFERGALYGLGMNTFSSAIRIC
jgi:hypothetical protein